ncbi:MAG: sel1 repeat family protein [Kofleriaceae bacterium]|nr:sel1 repeat family protein [Kofleriaceae bacterium]
MLVGIFSCANAEPTADVPAHQDSVQKSPASTIAQRGLDNAQAMMRNAKLCEPDIEAEDMAACERACLLNHSNSCANWGTLLSDSIPLRAIELYSTACKGGSGIGCEALARASELGQQAQLFHHARYYHRVHCNQGYGRSCYQLAQLYRTELGGNANPDAARDFQKRACTLGLQPACD